MSILINYASGSLTINEVLKEYFGRTKDFILTVGNSIYMYTYEYDDRDCEDYHTLHINGKEVWSSDKPCRNSKSEHQDAVLLKDILDKLDVRYFHKKEFGMTIVEGLRSSSISKTKMVEIINHLSIDMLEVKEAIKPNQSGAYASKIVLEALLSMHQPLNLNVDIVGIKTSVLNKLVASGNYTTINVISLIKSEWESSSEELKKSPLMFNLVKSWVIAIHSSIKSLSHVKIKDLSVEMDVQAIKLLRDMK